MEIAPQGWRRPSTRNTWFTGLRTCSLLATFHAYFVFPSHQEASFDTALDRDLDLGNQSQGLRKADVFPRTAHLLPGTTPPCILLVPHNAVTLSQPHVHW